MEGAGSNGNASIIIMKKALGTSKSDPLMAAFNAIALMVKGALRQQALKLGIGLGHQR
jgi:phage terminase large subunit-like protein